MHERVETYTHCAISYAGGMTSVTVTKDSGPYRFFLDTSVFTIAEPLVACFARHELALRTTVDGSCSNGGSAPVSSWSWNWGDGTSGSGAVASHTYAQGGMYAVTLTVTNTLGASASTSQDVAICNGVGTPCAGFLVPATALSYEVPALSTPGVPPLGPFVTPGATLPALCSTHLGIVCLGPGGLLDPQTVSMPGLDPVPLTPGIGASVTTTDLFAGVQPNLDQTQDVPEQDLGVVVIGSEQGDACDVMPVPPSWWSSGSLTVTIRVETEEAGQTVDLP